jgi:filamentous hemagglutinin family protein
MLRYGIWLGVLMAIVGMAEGVLAQSVIVPDETLGGERSVVTPWNAQIDVIEGGAARGINLFQSFREFNVGEGRTVYFTAPNLEIQNILARVTGTNPSEILGRLGTALIDGDRLVNSNASLFLINPNGIVFGTNSKLDVDKSFTATTASAIGFGSQGTFSASQPDTPSPLLIINPSAFLFSQVSPANITVQANQPIPRNGAFGLQVPNGQSLLLLGGNVAIDGGRLNAWEGRIEIGAVVAPGSIGLNPNGSLQFSADINRGDIAIINRSNLDTGLGGGGDIAIKARDLNIKSSVIQTGIFTGYGSPTSQAGDITLNTTGALAISQSDIKNWVFSGATGNGGHIFLDTSSLSLTEDSYMTAITYGIGSAGNIRVRTNGDVRLDTRSNIYSLSEEPGQGNAGNVEISAQNLLMTKGSQLSASTFGTGNGGNVILNIRDAVSLDGTDLTGRFPSAIFSSVWNDAIGQGGDIQITTGSLSITNSAKLDTSVFGTGDGGNVIINARDTVILDGITRGFKYGSAIFSTLEETGRGSAGDIRISTGSLSVLNGATIQSLTQNQGNAGNIFIDARNSVIIDGAGIQAKEANAEYVVYSDISSDVDSSARGNAGNILINAGDSILVNPVSNLAPGIIASSGQPATDSTSSLSLTGVKIKSLTSGQGNAGNILLSARNRIILDNEARVIASTDGIGNGGNVSVSAGNLVSLNNDSVIFSTVERDAIGAGGNISINTDTLSITNGSQLITTTLGQGNAGNVKISARDQITLSGFSPTGSSTLKSAILATVDAGSTGIGGDILLQTGSLSLTNSAVLTTGTSGLGNAGNIVIQALDQINLTTGARLTTETEAIGNAGQITIQAGGKIVLDSDAYITSPVRQGGSGSGGDVRIIAKNLSITNDSGLSSDIFGIGSESLSTAGNILINISDQLLLDRNSKISSTVGEEARGNGGLISVNAGSVSIRNSSGLLTNTLGRGNAGNITVNARGAVSLSNPNLSGPEFLSSSRFSSAVGEFGIGNAGIIRVTAGSLSISDNSVLQATTLGKGDAGAIFIDTRDFVVVDQGYVANLVGKAESPGQFGEGNGSLIQVDTGTLSLINGGQFQASTFGKGNAGNIVINANEGVYLNGFNVSEEGNRFYSAIFSVAGAASRGNGGNITINAKNLSALGGARLSAITGGQGRAGNIRIDAREFVLLDGVDPTTDASSGLFSGTEQLAQGPGGNINVNTNLFQISNNGIINAGTFTPFRGGDIVINVNIVDVIQGGKVISTANSQGNAGNIYINANQAKLSDRATISTSTARSDGGDITLNIGDLLFLRRGSSISTTAGTAEAGGNGGNISFNGGFIVAIPKENSDITANAFTGSGGRVNITSQGIFGLQFRPKLTPLSDITASSEAGLNGTISIATPDDSAIQNNLNQLPTDNIDTNKLLSKTCIVRKDQPEGTFHITGIDNIPNRPNDPTPSDYPTSTLQPSTQNQWKIGDPIAEPQGFYKLADGRLIMSRECDRTIENQ